MLLNIRKRTPRLSANRPSGEQLGPAVLKTPLQKWKNNDVCSTNSLPPWIKATCNRKHRIQCCFSKKNPSFQCIVHHINIELCTAEQPLSICNSFCNLSCNHTSKVLCKPPLLLAVRSNWLPSCIAPFFFRIVKQILKNVLWLKKFSQITG